MKFRAWDGSRMLEPQDLSQSGEYWKWLGKQDCELMQFTGLLDKNGKEIYEGDIVKGETTLPMRIIHQGHQYGIGYYADGKVQNDPLDGTTLQYLRDEGLEIIGNLYENPELGE